MAKQPGLSTVDAYVSHNGMDPFRQFVNLSVIAWFRPHRMRYGSDTANTSL